MTPPARTAREAVDEAADPGLVSGRALDACGHFVPEEAPEALLAELRAFLPGAA